MVVRRKNSEISARHERHGDLYWFGPPESKTLRPVWWWYFVESHLPPEEGVNDDVIRALEGCPRPPYIGWRALGYKSVSIYPTRLQYGRLIRTALNCLDCLVLYTKYLHVLGPHVRSGRVHGQVGGSSGRTGPPVGDGGDPSRWGPMDTHVSLFGSPRFKR
jgi:hypothetical protein